MDPSPRTPDRWRWVRRAAPWLIAGASVAAILIRYPVDRIVGEMQRGNTLAMVPIALAALATVWLTATLSDFVVLPPVVGAMRFIDLMKAKAGVSVLNAVGSAVNYGGYALWIQRRFRCRPAAAGGIVLFITLGDLCAVSLLAGAAMLIGGDDLPVEARSRLVVIAPIVFTVTVVLLLARPRRSQRPVLTPWRNITLAQRLIGLAARCGNITILMVSTWAASHAFGLDLPLTAVVTFLPILMVIGALPINVAGLGPVQAAWIALFAPYASPPHILAFQFLWHLMMLGALLLRGAPFLRAVVADVAGSTQRHKPSDAPKLP